TDGRRRIFGTFGGFESEAERLEETRKLLQWGLEGFSTKQLLAANEVVGEASVYGGKSDVLPLRVQEKVSVLAPVGHPDAVQARIVYERPLPAPIQEGDRV